MYQIHLEKVHADPHPGDFLLTEKKEIGCLRFWLYEEHPNDFYIPYFELIDKSH
jgi:predicted unusual protein kinase regulating ubiquinone biosynthesis (AarF/ABC1/UbiB family)